jgi:hypothetical protein
MQRWLVYILVVNLAVLIPSGVMVQGLSFEFSENSVPLNESADEIADSMEELKFGDDVFFIEDSVGLCMSMSLSIDATTTPCQVISPPELRLHSVRPPPTIVV